MKDKNNKMVSFKKQKKKNWFPRNDCPYKNEINQLGCSVGTCCAIRSSFSICNKVVLPALSSPRNTSFPFFFVNPGKKKLSFQNI